MPKISVIVPIYKAEKTIRRCIDSLLTQTLTDFELLLIDDGSPDNCGRICDEYAKNDKRVRVFHKKNGGVASARQLGIDNALGEYSIHADPDDWVEPTMLEELYKEAKEKEADMVICDFYKNHPGRQIYFQQKPSSFAPFQVFMDLLQGKLHGSTWNKLIKVELYSIYQVSFIKDMTYLEDLFVICRLLQYPIKITYLNKAFYHYDYFANNNSLSRKKTKNSIRSTIFFIDYFDQLLHETNNNDILFGMKLNCKEYMWYQSKEYSTKEIAEQYKEINLTFIKLFKKGHYQNDKTLYYVLSNHTVLAFFFRFISSLIHSIKQTFF